MLPLYYKVSYYEHAKGLPFPKQQILESSKLKEFADDHLYFDENGRKFS